MDAATECAVCLEPVASPVQLPCDCKVAYCAPCWDRSLAESFNRANHPRCPSCRMAVRVDFDSDTMKLKFSREGEDLASTETGNYNTVERIAKQSMPAQIRLLGEHGDRHPALLELPRRGPDAAAVQLSIGTLKAHIKSMGADIPASCVEKKDLVERFQSLCGGAATVLACCAEAAVPESPLCVCGASLTRVSARGRLRASAEHMLSSSGMPCDTPQWEEAVGRMVNLMVARGRGAVICDVCEAQADRSTGFWTCTARDWTIVHPTSHDICDRCFARFACGFEPAHVASDLEETADDLVDLFMDF